MKIKKVRKFKKAVFWFIAITLLFFEGCRKTEKGSEITVTPNNMDNIKDNISENVQNNMNQIYSEEYSVTAEVSEAGTSLLPHEILNPITVLGEYKTYYGDSSENRKANIENAAKKINNTILKPGEEFSCYKKLSPFTEENGYKSAGAYESGKIVKSVGGGVCQISTTLYNAVLLAELKVTERAAHSMTVSYVDVARDAAIAGDYKDLKFKNNLEEDVVIRAVTEDGWLICQIEGIETRKPSRTIVLETVILSQTEAGEDIVTVDESMKAGEERVTQSAHKGYKAELYKVIYKDGKETERIKINTSNYKPSPRYIKVGR